MKSLKKLGERTDKKLNKFSKKFTRSEFNKFKIKKMKNSENSVAKYEAMFKEVDSKQKVRKQNKKSIKDYLVEHLPIGTKSTKEKLIPIISKDRFLNEPNLDKVEDTTALYESILKTINNSIDSAVSDSGQPANFNTKYGPDNGLVLIKHQNSELEIIKIKK